MDHKAILSRLTRTAPSESVTVALELGASAISMAAVRRTLSPDGKVREEPIATESVPDAQAAKGFLDRWPAESTRLVAHFPRRHAIVRFLDLPSGDADELRAMARFQALASLPFDEEDLISDIAVLNSESGRSQVLLAIVRRNDLAPYLDLFGKLGRYPEAFVLSPLAVADAVRRDKNAAGRCLHVGLNDGWLDIDVIDDGRLAATRGIPWSKTPPDIPRIVSECRATLETVKGPKLGRIFIGEPTLREPLEKEFAAPTESSQPALLSAAYSDSSAWMDLLPPEISRARYSGLQRRELAGAALWLAVWLATLAGFGGIRLLRAEWRLSSLDARINKLEPAVRDALGDAQESRFTPPLDIIRELSRLTPSSVALRSIDRETDSGITIQGHAPQLAAVMEMMNALQKSPLLTHAELRSSALRSVQGLDQVDFQIHGELRRGT